MTFCSTCGAETTEQMKFCPNCGSRLSGISGTVESKPIVEEKAQLDQVISESSPQNKKNLIQTSIPLGADETILWHRELTSGLLQKHVTIEEAVTNKRCLKYDAENKKIVAQVSLIHRPEVVVMNVHRVNDSVGGGVFLTPRIFGIRIGGLGAYGGPRRGSVKIFGDANLICDGKIVMTFENMQWPQGLRQLVEHLKRQQGIIGPRNLGALRGQRLNPRA